MAFIKVPGPNEAGSFLKARYAATAKNGTKPANIVTIQGHNDRVLKSSMLFFRDLMFGELPLSRAPREMIATVVSIVNGCHY